MPKYFKKKVVEINEEVKVEEILTFTGNKSQLRISSIDNKTHTHTHTQPCWLVVEGGDEGDDDNG